MLAKLYYTDSYGYYRLWDEYPTEMAFLDDIVTEEINKGYNYFVCTPAATTAAREIFDFFDNNGFKYESMDGTDAIRITIMKKVPFD